MVTCQEYSIQQINSTTGLYIEEIATVQIHHTKWKLVSILDLSIYEKEYTYLNDLVSVTESLCNNALMAHAHNSEPDWYPYQSYCDITLQQVNLILKDINGYHSNWFATPTKETVRHKRSTINDLGNITGRLINKISKREKQTSLVDIGNITHELFNKLEKREKRSLMTSIYTFYSLLTNKANETKSIRKKEV